jgi:membrane protein DedA with SNARE-associated domain
MSALFVDFIDLFPFSTESGYLSLALINFFGSLVPFVPLPGFILLATMAVETQYDLHALALISAITATIAKQIIFYLSYGGRRIINEKTRKKMRPFERLVKRYGAAAAFIAAATPIPDDLVYVPLGLAKYNPKRFFIATLTGKIVLSYTIVLVSHFLGVSLIQPFLENINDPTPIYIGIIVFAIMMTVAIIALLRLDWQKILGKFAPWTLDENNDN